MMFEVTGITCVMMPSRMARTVRIVNMAMSHSGMPLPFIRIFSRALATGRQMKDRTAARMM